MITEIPLCNRPIPVVDRKPVYEFFKRLFDIVFSAILLVALLPLFLVLAIAIVIDDPHAGPIYSQIRVGERGKLFRLYKFRSMIAKADDMLEELADQNMMEGPAFKIKHDPRVTRVGRFTRATNLDELAQLVNILLGHMSFVGPRPPLPNEVAEYTDDQLIRIAIKPGLTCYWQMQLHRNRISFDEWVEFDKKYIAERNILTDIKIVIETALSITYQMVRKVYKKIRKKSAGDNNHFKSRNLMN